MSTTELTPDLYRSSDDRSVIADSWKRCMDSYGLDPSQRLSTRVLTSTQYKELRDRMGHLLDTANEEMTHLLQAVGKTGYAMLLTDRHGIILRNVCDPNYDVEFRRAGLWEGADWGEEREGTNGMGTCAAEKRPVTIHLDEHFFEYNSQLTCTAAPIFDPRGELLAVLDSSSCRSNDSRASQLHLRALLCMSATQISNSNFLWEYRKSLVLRFQTRYEYVGLFNDGIMALDNEGHILAANDSAVSMLGRCERADLINLKIEEIVDVSMDSLLASASGHVSPVWPMYDVISGYQFYAMACSAQPECSPTVCVGVDVEQKTRRFSLADLGGNDPQMIQLTDTARKIAGKKIPILLQGETGTGKEVLARAIHAESARADQPFVAVNCSAIPEPLIESELFGYTHGAFTGARRKGFKGRLIVSDGGTIFLDEIGDMPAKLQTRLLRVLEDGEVTPLGSEQSVKLDLNVISATHQNLDKLIADGLFRSDLYFRLRGICLNLVPLRQRSDCHELIQKLIKRETGYANAVTIDGDLLNRLAHYHWPGNIRQAKNAVVSALALCENAHLHPGDFPRECLCDGPSTSRKMSPLSGGLGHSLAGPAAYQSDPLAEAEKFAIITALTKTKGNVSRAAEELAISRNTLYRKFKRHGISRNLIN